MKELSSFKWVLCVAALSYTSACDPGIEQDAEPSSDNVVAVYSPTAKTLPLPNSAALEKDGTLPSLSTGEDTALNLAYDYIGGYTGWSPKTPIKIPFSGELDPETISGNVKLYQVKRHTVEEIASDSKYILNEDGTLCDKKFCASVIIVVPKEALIPGEQYAVVATKDILGANGNPIKEDAPVFFGLSKNTIFEDGEVKLKLFRDKPETARSLEGIRQQLAPIVGGLELDRDNVASIFTWTVVQNGFTVLDPASSTLPIPNTLALEFDGTFPSSPLNYCAKIPAVTDMCEKPKIEVVKCKVKDDCKDSVAGLGKGYTCISGVCKNDNCAQGEFDAYLDGLHGWPTTVPITLPITGTIDVSTLSPETVQLFEIKEGVPTKVANYAVSLDPCGNQIVITPDAPMGYNTKYFAFATRDVKTLSEDAQGNTQKLDLLPPPEVFLAIQPNPVFEAGDKTCEAADIGKPCESGGVCSPFTENDATVFKCGTSLIKPLGVDDAAAFRLHAIRPLLRGTAEVIEKVASKDYLEIAAIWSWYTWTDTFSVFDPTGGSIPFPNTFLTTGCPQDRPICNIPKGDNALSMGLYEELSRRPGFTTTAPSWIPFLGPDPKVETLTSENVLFAEADVQPPPLFPKEEYDVSLLEGNAVLKFKRPLKKGILVAGLMTTNVKGANGFGVQPTPAFVFLRSQYPLVDADGNSKVAQIPSNEVAQTLEAARKQFKQLFLVATLFGYEKSQISNAWAYQTQDTTRPIQELRALTLDQLSTNGVPDVTETKAKNEVSPFANGDGTTSIGDQAGVKVDMSNIDSIHWNMEFNSYWWLDAAAHLSLGMPTRQMVGLSVFVPKTTASCSPPFDVAIVQHGYTGYRKRTALAYANDLAGNCIATVAMDLPLHGGRIVGSTDLHPDIRPVKSGEGFISLDFIAVKSMFMQTTVDLTIITRLIKSGKFNTLLGATFSNNTSKVGFIGQSIGSLIGTLFVTIENEIDSAVLNVGGGYFYELLTQSDEFSKLFGQLGLMPGSLKELQTLSFIQWLGDYIDPYAFSPYTVKNPIKDLSYNSGTNMYVEGADLPANKIMIQMVTGDTVVPNSGTISLAKQMDVDLSKTTYPQGVAHGFVSQLDTTDAVNGKPALCARKQGSDFLLNAFGTATTLISATDCINQ